MMIAIHHEQLRGLLAGTAIIAAKSVEMILGGNRDSLLQKDAYAMYGNKKVKKWHKDGLLHPKRSGTCVYYPKIELMIASQSEMITKLTPMAADELREYFNKQVNL